MIKINLLDWREAKRQLRQQQFFIALGASLVAGAITAYAMNSKVTGDIDHQIARNNLLRQESKAIDKQIEEIKQLEKVKADLLARMRIIEELQRSRTRIVHFFDEVVGTTPPGLYITNLSQKGKVTRITGVAESNGRVSSYIRNLDNSDWFDNASLIVIEAREKTRRKYNDFQLQFSEAKQKSEEDSE
ncbi:MAG: PilN domain-containing protein [Oceanococcus sp.]